MAMYIELLYEGAMSAAIVVATSAAVAARKQLGLMRLFARSHIAYTTTQSITQARTTADDVVADSVKCRCQLSVQRQCYK